MKTDNIYLIGFMGAGKTTVGKELEKLISYKFQDMDELIVEDSNMEITEIFASSFLHEVINIKTIIRKNLTK